MALDLGVKCPTPGYEFEKSFGFSLPALKRQLTVWQVGPKPNSASIRR